MCICVFDNLETKQRFIDLSCQDISQNISFFPQMFQINIDVSSLMFTSRKVSRTLTKLFMLLYGGGISDHIFQRNVPDWLPLI